MTAHLIAAAETFGRMIRTARTDAERVAAEGHFEAVIDTLYAVAAEGDEMAADFLDIDARAIRDENEEALALLAAYDAREAA